MVFPEVFVPGTPIWIDTRPIWDGDDERGEYEELRRRWNVSMAGGRSPHAHTKTE